MINSESLLTVYGKDQYFLWMAFKKSSHIIRQQSALVAMFLLEWSQMDINRSVNTGLTVGNCKLNWTGENDWNWLKLVEGRDVCKKDHWSHLPHWHHCSLHRLLWPHRATLTLPNRNPKPDLTLNPNPKLTFGGAGRSGGLFHTPVKKAITVSDHVILLPLVTL